MSNNHEPHNPVQLLDEKYNALVCLAEDLSRAFDKAAMKLVRQNGRTHIPAKLRVRRNAGPNAASFEWQKVYYQRGSNGGKGTARNSTIVKGGRSHHYPKSAFTFLSSDIKGLVWTVEKMMVPIRQACSEILQTRRTLLTTINRADRAISDFEQRLSDHSKSIRER
ncbi:MULTISPECIES: conjugative transfer protein MobI(A/C) [Pseudomonas]|uniref:conjugative transfer protein MobI(A/C) n=1 Tax=Pseudomonas TaxID=286 RepID=UPI0008F18018|nr:MULTISPECIES: conjugative transfer protein MobI(A/C) [Pseudomonas]SFU17891.1 hypothetical protein SAMN05216264_11852 [Pseudomonas marincola]